MRINSTNILWYSPAVTYLGTQASESWLDQAERWLRKTLRHLARKARAWISVATNVSQFVASFRVLRWQVDAQGGVVVTHVPTGSVTTFRADGNVDVLAARNAMLGARGLTLLGSDPDDLDHQEVPRAK